MYITGCIETMRPAWPEDMGNVSTILLRQIPVFGASIQSCTPNFFYKNIKIWATLLVLIFYGFQHQNVLIFSLIQACMFLIIYEFACFYWIRLYTTIMDNVGISMNCSQYIHYTTIIFIIYSVVVHKKSINFL